MEGLRVRRVRRMYIMLMGAILSYRKHSKPLPCLTFSPTLDSRHLILINTSGPT
jgi:hypothetical protein